MMKVAKEVNVPECSVFDLYAVDETGLRCYSTKNCGKTLFSYINDLFVIRESEFWSVLAVVHQSLKALFKLHAANIAHLDIKTNDIEQSIKEYNVQLIVYNSTLITDHSVMPMLMRYSNILPNYVLQDTRLKKLLQD